MVEFAEGSPLPHHEVFSVRMCRRYPLGSGSMVSRIFTGGIRQWMRLQSRLRGPVRSCQRVGSLFIEKGGRVDVARCHAPLGLPPDAPDLRCSGQTAGLPDDRRDPVRRDRGRPSGIPLEAWGRPDGVPRRDVPPIFQGAPALDSFGSGESLDLDGRIQR